MANIDKKSSVYTRTKNYFESVRNGVNGEFSSENKYAKWGQNHSVSPVVINKDTNQVVWSQENYRFLEKEYTPDTSYDANGNLRIHPTLWNNGTNNWLSGVFEVIPNVIYQVRGYDMANITFVRCGVTKNNDGKFPSIDENSHWIVMDTLMSKECTRDALVFFENYIMIERKINNYTLKGKIVGAIISHSHIDHYGGIEEVKEYFCPKPTDKGDTDLPFIFVPKGFYEAAVSENVYVGNAMGRRASYQYGSFIKPTYSGTGSNIDDYTSGSISIGIGQGQSTGSPSAVPYDVTEIDCNCKKVIDSITVDFQLTPGTEAPAEMNTYFPDYNALWLAENCTGTLHNLYTLRGAQVRDAKAWANFLMEAAYKYGDKTDVIFQSHNWPHWGTQTFFNVTYNIPTIKSIRDFLIDTAAVYKYIHDQTLLYMNMGYKMDEVSDMLTLPRGMQKNWCLKPFYGTPKHNSKAVYQKYLGWYDANPLHLEELPPEQLAKEMLRYMKAGSEEKVLDMIRLDINNGNYWTAAYMAHQIILSDSNNLDTAKQLCADAMQQLGYQCESGTWRNAYLSAAYELRNGKHHDPLKSGSLGDMPPEMLLDYMSIFFDGERAATQLKYNGYLNVEDKKFMFVVRNGAILYYDVSQTTCCSNAGEITIPKSVLYDVINGVYPDPNKTYPKIYDILVKISKAIVNINCYRFKQFDIIGRHDREVYFDNEIVDLKNEVQKCITILEPYIDKFENKTAIYLSDDDKVEWKTHYYPLLKTETQVLLESDFFKPQDATQGIGRDGYFQPYELYYTLYSLYRYLYSGYLKNDYDFKGNNYDQESFVKLKKSIVLLESYVADYYLKTANAIVEFDEQDSNAFHYLNNESIDNSIIKLNESDFFFELYKNYKGLAEEIKSSSKNLYFEYSSSAKEIVVRNARRSLLKVNNVVLDNSSTDSVKIDISKMDNTIVIESFDKGGTNANKLVTGRLVFHKPEIIKNVPRTSQTNVSIPNPFINFHTKYTNKLYVGTEEQESAEYGRYLIGSKATIKAVSSVGFYVECSFE